MSENEDPTREEVQALIDESSSKAEVYDVLAMHPSGAGDKIKDDLISYPGWEELDEG